MYIKYQRFFSVRNNDERKWKMSGGDRWSKMNKGMQGTGKTEKMAQTTNLSSFASQKKEACPGLHALMMMEEGSLCGLEACGGFWEEWRETDVFVRAGRTGKNTGRRWVHVLLKWQTGCRSGWIGRQRWAPFCSERWRIGWQIRTGRSLRELMYVDDRASVVWTEDAGKVDVVNTYLRSIIQRHRRWVTVEEGRGRVWKRMGVGVKQKNCKDGWFEEWMNREELIFFVRMRVHRLRKLLRIFGYKTKETCQSICCVYSPVCLRSFFFHIASHGHRRPALLNHIPWGHIWIDPCSSKTVPWIQIELHSGLLFFFN